MEGGTSKRSPGGEALMKKSMGEMSHVAIFSMRAGFSLHMRAIFSCGGIFVLAPT